MDKSSTAELSEAINSMWAWYGRSQVCYAYLPGVPPGIDIKDEDSAFCESRWFTRGWTLQELLSPRNVAFYDQSWNVIGQKHNIGSDRAFIRALRRITRIPANALISPRSVNDYSVAQKMSWASHRTTTRVEDIAYSLFGLFGINMPLLYGTSLYTTPRRDIKGIRR
jgi:hypothetical protein